ncbi:hypothetical protein [Hippea maritima]|uniref:Uncharacterized protein n=1 Tax=Hippea maritima (strain ATCC 700847 / DSM 10411 / MH2) TaxID=760142 RepID=F2LWJ9_HIPMA|nr:hypothetical protein [Hippea maritima]AEA34108.1 hypothetical protein Hipma_1142 [Hippea maritima DSM 10411]
MRLLFLAFIIFFITPLAFGGGFPIFKLPSNEKYKLFEYSPEKEIQNKNIKIQKKKPDFEFKIYGVFISDGQKIVLIGKKIYKEGDKIGDYTIKKIENSKVVLSKDSREIVKTISNDTNPLLFDNDTLKTP